MSRKAYVTEYGNWGLEEVLILGENDLTSKQWANLEILPDYEKLPYAKAILAGEDTSGWEE